MNITYKCIQGNNETLNGVLKTGPNLMKVLYFVSFQIGVGKCVPCRGYKESIPRRVFCPHP